MFEVRFCKNIGFEAKFLAEIAMRLKILELGIRVEKYHLFKLFQYSMYFNSIFMMAHDEKHFKNAFYFLNLYSDRTNQITIEKLLYPELVHSYAFKYKFFARI